MCCLFEYQRSHAIKKRQTIAVYVLTQELFYCDNTMKLILRGGNTMAM